MHRFRRRHLLGHAGPGEGSGGYVPRPRRDLLTDGNATKATAAAKAAVPGATVIRVETDSYGAAYEAHMKKADGTDIITP